MISNILLYFVSPPGKPFHIEDLLERVKSNRLKNSIKEVLIPRERLDLGEIIGRGK